MLEKSNRDANARRLRAASIVVCALFFVVWSVAVEAAPPTRLKPRETPGASTNATKNASEATSKGTSNGTPRSPSRPPRVQRPRETNDGALPSAEDFSFAWTDEADVAANWLDPAKTQELRKQTLAAAQEQRERWPKFGKIDEARANSLKIRRVSGKRVVLYTDLPSRAEVDQIPEALDASIPLLCDFFKIDKERFATWRVDAFLMGDVDSYISLGVLDGPPRFLYGYSMCDRIFAKDQKCDYYNRFLLQHELVHTFMHEVFGDLRPRWYSEGMAEYLALHTWDPKSKRLEIAQIPESEEATPGFGRLAQVREIVRARKAPTLYEILSFEPRDFVDVSTYSWSWAFVMFLNNSPKYRDVAEVLPYWSIADDPNRLFTEAIGERWGELENDWADFVGQIDYSYDFESTSIDMKPDMGAVSDAAALKKGVVVEVDPSRGWQNSGVRVESGKSYRLATSGRFTFYLSDKKRALEFEATGATYRYFNGLPIGRLQAAVVPDVEEETFAATYGFDSDEDDAPSNARNGRDGFRFNAFANMRGTTRTRFGDGRASGFDDDKTNDAETNSANAASRLSNERLYNATYPWNDGVSFAASSTTLTPKRSGTLYFRVNCPPKDLKRNSGVVKTLVKEN